MSGLKIRSAESVNHPKHRIFNSVAFLKVDDVRLQIFYFAIRN